MNITDNSNNAEESSERGLGDIVARKPIAVSNLTRANVTGKVITKAKRLMRRRGKPVKMASHQRKHVHQMQSKGVISPSAAARHGLDGAKK
jgi:hypothetical protein